MRTTRPTLRFRALAALFARSEKRLSARLVLRCRLGPPRPKLAAPRLARSRTDEPERRFPRTAIALLRRGRGADPAPALEQCDTKRLAARPRCRRRGQCGSPFLWPLR